MKATPEMEARWAAEEKRHADAQRLRTEVNDIVHGLIDRYISLQMLVSTLTMNGGLYEKSTTELSFAATRKLEKHLGVASAEIRRAVWSMEIFLDGEDAARVRDVLYLGYWREDTGRPE